MSTAEQIAAWMGIALLASLALLCFALTFMLTAWAVDEIRRTMRRGGDR